MARTRMLSRKYSSPRVKTKSLTNGDNSEEEESLLEIDLKDVVKVKQLIDKGVNVDEIGKHRESPLVVSVQKSYEYTVELLLNAGAFVDTKNILGKTPLMYACERNLTRSVHMLIDHGASVHLVDGDGKSALIYACEHENENAVNIIVGKSVFVNLLNVLLGKRINCVNLHNMKTKETPLMIACKVQHVGIVKTLIKKYAFKHLQDNFGYTALMYACQNENANLEIVKMVSSKNSINLQAKNLKTALMIAISWGNSKVAEFLIMQGADLNYLDYKKRSTLLTACEDREWDIAKMIINRGVDVNIQNIYGMSAIMYACLYGEIEIVNLLIQNKADVNLRNNQGFNALMLASIPLIVIKKPDNSTDTSYNEKTKLLCVKSCYLAGSLLNVITRKGIEYNDICCVTLKTIIEDVECDFQAIGALEISKLYTHSEQIVAFLDFVSKRNEFNDILSESFKLSRGDLVDFYESALHDFTPIALKNLNYDTLKMCFRTFNFIRRDLTRLNVIDGENGKNMLNVIIFIFTVVDAILMTLLYFKAT